MLVPATQMSTKVAARLGGKLSDVASRAQGVNVIIIADVSHLSRLHVLK